ncbi:MAG: hypothetical protein HYU41_15075 [Candidatus Rokubacteria bacterium]|nr:hypothetical protein [Candidatus Rokubacteria bacterium]
MAIRKKIKDGQKVAVNFTPRERLLVLDQTFAGPDLTVRLRRAALVGGRHVAWYTLSDLDELLGFIAAEANHSTDKKVRKGLDALYARLRRKMESYDDGLWQGAF